MSEQTLIKYLKEQILQQQTIIEDLLMGVDDNELEKEKERLDNKELKQHSYLVKIGTICFAEGCEYYKKYGERKLDDHKKAAEDAVYSAVWRTIDDN